MTRFRTTRWSRLRVTPPIEFLTRPEGQRLLDLLTGWWLAGEGIVPHAAVDPSVPAIDQRYRLAAFYRLLDDAEFGRLADRDEHALDAVHRAFAEWTVSGPARRLSRSPAAPAEARERIRRALVASRDELLGGAKRLLGAASSSF